MIFKQSAGAPVGREGYCFMKKFTALILVLVMLLAFAACGSGGSSGSGASGTDVPSGGTVKLSALIHKGNALTKSINEMQWLKELASECGIEITEWREYGDDWGQVKNVLYASGDIPDLLFNATTSQDFYMYTGLFEELTPLIDSCAPNIKKMFKEQPDTLARAKGIDDKIFGVGNYNSEQVTVQGSTFINKVWLDNLGLSVPTNWDELYNVLKAFRNGDPNKNGSTTDEIPMDFWFMSTYGAINLIGSTGIQTVSLSSNESGFFAEDSIVKNYYVDPRFRELIVYLHKLYSEGLINPEAFTHDYGAMTTLAQGSGKTARVGVQFAWDAATIFGTTLADQYIVLPPLKQSATSTDNVRYCYESFKAFSSSAFAVSMSTSCPNKEAAMRFFDAFYSPRNSAQSLYGGIKDGYIKDEGNDTFTVLPPEDASFNGTVWMWTNTLGPIGPYYIYDGLLNNAPDTDKPKEEKLVYDEAHSRIDFKKDFFGYMYFKVPPEDDDVLALNSASLETDWVTWIKEGVDDTTWKTHVNNMMNSGLQKMLDIFQKHYNEYVAGLK